MNNTVWSQNILYEDEPGSSSLFVRRRKLHFCLALFGVLTTVSLSVAGKSVNIFKKPYMKVIHSEQTQLKLKTRIGTKPQSSPTAVEDTKRTNGSVGCKKRLQ